LQRVISGCGGQFIDFPQNVTATRFSFDTFLLAGKRKVCSACKAALKRLKSQCFLQRDGVRNNYIGPAEKHLTLTELETYSSNWALQMQVYLSV